ncbi:unnamed protein product [Auanema sp. JU1783]|nr:unnamed protein product [Auanema sp. JU1783]
MQSEQILLVLLLSSSVLAYYTPRQSSYGSNKPSRGYNSPGGYKPPGNPPVQFFVPPPLSSESSSEEDCDHEECHSIIDSCLSSSDPNCRRLIINSNSPDVDVSCKCDDCDYLLLLDENNRILKNVSRKN